MLKKILKAVALVLAVVVVGAVVYAGAQVYAFNASMEKVYDVPMPTLQASTEPAVLERGKHLAESMGSCSSIDCHGPDLAGGKSITMGPLGTLTGPNITPAGVVALYSDGELARLILHGVRKDGRSLRFMPAQDFAWWPDPDIQALISYVRSVPAVQKADGPLELGLLAKILDRHDKIVIDVARRIPHTSRPTAPAPAPTAAYGAFIAKSCLGCHGEHLSGGPIPGAPPSLAVPANITPHETGMKKYTFEMFEHLLLTGEKPDGKKLDPMMPYEALGKMNDTEKRALFSYLQSVEPRPFGGR